MNLKPQNLPVDSSLSYDSSGELTFESIPISRLADRYGTPLYAYSAPRIKHKARELKAAFRVAKPVICFALKANSNLSVLSLIKSLGLGADVVSLGELERCRKTRFQGRKIVFSGVGKRRDEIEAALKYSSEGIFSINCESVEELERIQSIAKRMNRKARVALRFTPGIDARTHENISTGRKEDKFGLLESEVRGVARRKAEFTHVDLHGLSVHIGSQITELAPMRKAFERVLELWNELSDPLDFTFLDLGGGLGVRYGNEPSVDLRAYARLIERLFFGPLAKRKPKTLVLEPGRWMIAEAGILISRVEYRKPRPDFDLLVIDAGMNDLMRPALYSARHPLFTGSSLAGSPLKKTTVVGPVCESSDVFLKGIDLPQTLKSGDLVVLGAAGAYGASMSNRYNTRAMPAEALCSEGRAALVRKRESLSDSWKSERIAAPTRV